MRRRHLPQPAVLQDNRVAQLGMRKRLVEEFDVFLMAKGISDGKRRI